MQLLWNNNMYPQSELDNYKLQVDLLQEKLKQSEENRQQLQKELQQILQRRSEHDKSVRTKILRKYQSFLEEQERRNDRNKMLMQMLERIDQQSAALSARSERLKMMKLQYERHFAKLMQVQPVRCMPSAAELNMTISSDAAPLTVMSGSTQIPVFLPAQQAAPTLPTNAFDGGIDGVTGVAQAPQRMTASNETQSTALAPHMWTFTMATPTPTGLLFTGPRSAPIPTSPLTTTTTPFEVMQYPLGYAPIIQQTIPQQVVYTASTSNGTVPFGNRANNLSQTNNVELRDKKFTYPSSYVLTAEAATSTEFTMITDDDTKATRDLLERPHIVSTPHASKAVEQNQVEGKSNTYTVEQTHISSSQAPTPASDEPLTQHLDYDLNGSEVTKYLSELKLEKDENINDTSTTMKITPIGSFEKPKMDINTPYNYEESRDKPKPLLGSQEDWQNTESPNLSTAEDHLRKFAEIERKYGPIYTEEGEEDPDVADIDYKHRVTVYKPFSDIVNPESNLTEKAPTAVTVESAENQSVKQSYSGSSENALPPTGASVATSSKPVSIDNIENAIYGELVHPQLHEPKATNVDNPAQGFFTELLDQQDMTRDTNNIEEISPQQPEQTTNRQLEVDTLTLNIDKTISADGDAGLDHKLETPLNDEQYQPTYDTSNNEAYQHITGGASGIAEATNNYVEYPTEQTIDPNATDASNTSQHDQQMVYSQQDYGNYDSSQYGYSDPNAYPGYIYDEAIGRYVIDPQYVAADGSNVDVAYSIQDYGEHASSEQQQQQQVNYENTQSQEVTFGYEESTSSAATSAPTATFADVITPEHTAAAETTIQPVPAKLGVTPVAVGTPKVSKPTSILSTAEKHTALSEAQKKKKRVNFVDSSETDESSGAKAPCVSAAAEGASESDFDFSSGAETSVG